MAEIDWNIVLTVLISAIVPIVIAIVPLMLNEKEKRKFMKTKRLWNLKCGKFERLIDIINRLYILSITRQRIKDLKPIKSEDGLKIRTDDFVYLASEIDALAARYPQLKSYGFPKDVPQEAEDDVLSFLDLVSKTDISLKRFMETFGHGYRSVLYKVRLHLLDPKLGQAVEDMLDFLTDEKHEMRRSPLRRGSMSFEEIDKRFGEKRKNLHTLMKTELEETLKT